VYKVLRVAADNSSAASSNGSSAGASSSQEFAMKVFTVRTSRSQATTWTQRRQALSKQQQQSTLAAKQQQPGLASQQQQGSVRAAAGGPAAGRLHSNGTEAEQQQQQHRSQPTQASLQQQSLAAQHTAAEQHRAASTSSGDSGMSEDPPRSASQQLEQQSPAVNDSNTFAQDDEIRKLQVKLGDMKHARNIELQLMLLARGDLRGACIAIGLDSSIWPPATPEHELCSGVLRVEGWGQFSMQIEQLQVPVLVSELCSCTVADLLQLIHAANNSSGVQRYGLTCEETRHLARQLLPALASMHKAGIVHRDIKPGDPGNDWTVAHYQHVVLAVWGQSGSLHILPADINWPHCSAVPVLRLQHCSGVEPRILSCLVIVLTMCMRQQRARHAVAAATALVLLVLQRMCCWWDPSWMTGKASGLTSSATSSRSQTLAWRESWLLAMSHPRLQAHQATWRQKCARPTLPGVQQAARQLIPTGCSTAKVLTCTAAALWWR
jgi:hypothetical protein